MTWVLVSIIGLVACVVTGNLLGGLIWGYAILHAVGEVFQPQRPQDTPGWRKQDD